MSNLTNYIKDTIAEMKQVTWPTQKQAFVYTLLVILISVVVALFLGAFDYLFSQGIDFLINKTK
jgi:preprotein translocase subunit SecE